MYSVSLDQDLAKRLTRDGATLLLLGVPAGTVVGIDQQKQITGPKFMGVKMVPPGVHMVSFNSVGSQGDFSPSTSFFVTLGQSQVVVRKWDHESEMLLPLDNEDEVARYALGVARFDFDQGLAPYNLHAYQQWQALAGYIDSATVARLSPAGSGCISITAEAGPGEERYGAATEAEEALSKQLSESRLQGEGPGGVAPARPSGGAGGVNEAADVARSGIAQSATSNAVARSIPGRCYYTAIPRTVKSKGLSAAALTMANLDKSRMLEDLITKNFQGKEDTLLGELQFAFLAFLVGQSLQGWGHWKEVLHLTLGCEEAPLITRPSLYARLLRVLQAQLECSMGGSAESPNNSSQGGPARKGGAAPLGVPMVDELLDDSFLRRLFCHFYETLATASGELHPALKEAADSLHGTLERTLGWDFRLTEVGGDGSDDEYAPQVVEL